MRFSLRRAGRLPSLAGAAEGQICGREAEEYYKEALRAIPSVKATLSCLSSGKRARGHGVGKQLLKHFEETFRREADGIFMSRRIPCAITVFMTPRGFTLCGSKKLTHDDGSPFELFLYTK